MKDLKIDESTGLVLEGGGMRGVFTCGVLDYFMDHDIRFPYAIGVSPVRATGCRMHHGSGDVPSTATLTCWRSMIISV